MRCRSSLLLRTCHIKKNRAFFFFFPVFNAPFDSFPSMMLRNIKYVACVCASIIALSCNFFLPLSCHKKRVYVTYVCARFIACRVTFFFNDVKSTHMLCEFVHVSLHAVITFVISLCPFCLSYLCKQISAIFATFRRSFGRQPNRQTQACTRPLPGRKMQKGVRHRWILTKLRASERQRDHKGSHRSTGSRCFSSSALPCGTREKKTSFAGRTDPQAGRKR